MVIVTTAGETLRTAVGSKVSFEKIDKRWFLKARYRGEKETRNIAVKHIREIGGRVRHGVAIEP